MYKLGYVGCIIIVIIIIIDVVIIIIIIVAVIIVIFISTKSLDPDFVFSSKSFRFYSGVDI